ncbi:hypothetical protein M011DRAFT_432137 [Sporormia fimetaria CBS 119925]|uniref:DUF1640-domain-containing protein n=1 Tax=Sporormia fimetaria CBS 119925 TaxID=1340428 RepID=A0A6A6UXC7_9PLEO|nr:hypothetical protein M011DRAFT_432137 [Sporormia fimetaria CBS 119925]
MAAPRLPFLWPMLFRPARVTGSAPRVACWERRPVRRFTTSVRRSEPPSHQRYGTAQEPEPHLREQVAQKERDVQSLKEQVAAVEEKAKKAPLAENGEEEEENNNPGPTIPSTTTSKTADVQGGIPSPIPDPPRTGDAKPLETVLHMPPPDAEDHKPPHLKTPPYIHHFDTYSLVKRLTTGGFSEAQAVTTMKAVRGILTSNIELARASLVSKSNVENETYLFRAACSELRIEVENNRKGEIEKLRTERNQLQHEVDILNQKLGQETSHLKDELKGLFDDRKMAVRQEQRTMESKIQELNYKITVALNSDARSEVEGLRWILTRRAAITIGISAFFLFVALRYSSYVAHSNAEGKKSKGKPKPPSDEEQNDPPPLSDNPPSSNLAVNGQEPLGGELLTTTGGVSLG